MNTYNFPVVRGGLEWFGFDVIQKGPLSFLIREGRIGRTAKPLEVTEYAVDGGWYFDELEIDLREEDTMVDLLLEYATDDLVILVRGGTMDETYDSDAFDYMIPLLIKNDGEWFTPTPYYEEIAHAYTA